MMVCASRRCSPFLLLSVLPQPATLQTELFGMSSLFLGMKIQFTVLLALTVPCNWGMHNVTASNTADSISWDFLVAFRNGDPAYSLALFHCFSGQVMTVVIGAHNLMDDSVDRIPVKFYHIYPGYTYLFNNDIMLLQLENPVQRGAVVDWISIPKTNDDIEANTICSIAGWGRTSSDGSQSDHLMEANVRIIDSRKCKKDWGHYYSSVNMMCAGSGHGFCQGDSGGPLVCNNVAVGIVSFFEAGNCDKPIVPNVYTKISQFLPWIKEVINSV
uniref:Granzyme B-like n=1 Tax=Astyanax mexicanus TaxID=7994 RepID=W5K0L6_ASTMX